MPVIPRSGVYPNPVVPSRQEVETMDGRVDLSFIPYLAEGIESVRSLNPFRRKKRDEPVEPPKPPEKGGGKYSPVPELYTMNVPHRIAMAAYRNAIDDTLRDGDKVIRFRDRREMLAHRESIGYEYRDFQYERPIPVIEMSDDMHPDNCADPRLALDVLCHERYGSDLFRGKPRWDGDHASREDEIKRGTVRSVTEYLREAAEAA